MILIIGIKVRMRPKKFSKDEKRISDYIKSFSWYYKLKWDIDRGAFYNLVVDLHACEKNGYFHDLPLLRQMFFFDTNNALRDPTYAEFYRWYKRNPFAVEDVIVYLSFKHYGKEYDYTDMDFQPRVFANGLGLSLWENFKRDFNLSDDSRSDMLKSYCKIVLLRIAELPKRYSISRHVVGNFGLQLFKEYVDRVGGKERFLDLMNIGMVSETNKKDLIRFLHKKRLGYLHKGDMPNYDALGKDLSDMPDLEQIRQKWVT